MINFEKHILSNGLKILAHYDPSTPMVTTNLLYNVGSRDEDPDATGFAHLFEHLMFEGSDNVPVFDTPVMLAGGENNAFTNSDITNYFITLPSENLETALWLESDRLKGPDLSDEKLKTQKSVVTEEYRQRYLNQPYGDLFLLLRPLAYKKHPYQWPTIGKDIAHIQNADRKSVTDFFRRHYRPSNAILSTAGNVKPEAVFRLVEKWFNDIAPGKPYTRILPLEPVQDARREMTVHRRVPSAELLMAFHTGGRTSRDFYILDLLTDILSGCDSGRFPGILVREKELFSEADIYLSAEIDPGLAIVSGRLKEGVDIRTAEKAVRNELNRVAGEQVTAAELDKARNRYESHQLMSFLSAGNKAFNLAYNELLGDANGINSEKEKYMSVTAEEIMECSARTFTESNCSVIHYLPETL
jgi:predicted Zn-dependent peptidase